MQRLPVLHRAPMVLFTLLQVAFVGIAGLWGAMAVMDGESNGMLGASVVAITLVVGAVALRALGTITVAASNWWSLAVACCWFGVSWVMSAGELLREDAFAMVAVAAGVGLAVAGVVSQWTRTSWNRYGIASAAPVVAIGSAWTAHALHATGAGHSDWAWDLESLSMAWDRWSWSTFSSTEATGLSLATLVVAGLALPQARRWLTGGAIVVLLSAVALGTAVALQEGSSDAGWTNYDLVGDELGAPPPTTPLEPGLAPAPEPGLAPAPEPGLAPAPEPGDAGSAPARIEDVPAIAAR